MGHNVWLVDNGKERCGLLYGLARWHAVVGHLARWLVCLGERSCNLQKVLLTSPNLKLATIAASFCRGVLSSPQGVVSVWKVPHKNQSHWLVWPEKVAWLAVAGQVAGLGCMVRQGVCVGGWPKEWWLG